MINLAFQEYMPHGEIQETLPLSIMEILIKYMLKHHFNQSKTFIKFISSIIKFDYKRKLPFDQFYKFLQHCISTNKEIQVRLIYKDQKIIQSCNVNFNFYFYQGQQSTNYLQNSEKNVDLLQSLIKNAGWE